MVNRQMINSWQTITRGSCVSKAWKPPSWRLILIYLNLEASLHSLLSFAWTLTRPTNYSRQNIVFSYPEMIRVSFSLFLSLSVFCYFTLLLIFMKIILLLLIFLIFMKIIFIFSCFGMFRDVPECSGMFRNVPCSGFYRQPPFTPSVRRLSREH